MGTIMIQTGSSRAEAKSVDTPASIAVEVAAMLADILAKTSVSPDADFFMLGGDSLSATELMLAIEERYGVVMDRGEIFEQPRISLFAEIISDLLKETR